MEDLLQHRSSRDVGTSEIKPYCPAQPTGVLHGDWFVEPEFPPGFNKGLFRGGDVRHAQIGHGGIPLGHAQNEKDNHGNEDEYWKKH